MTLRKKDTWKKELEEESQKKGWLDIRAAGVCLMDMEDRDKGMSRIRRSILNTQEEDK